MVWQEPTAPYADLSPRPGTATARTRVDPPVLEIGRVWREPTAPRTSSSDVATACAVGGWFLEYGWTTLGRNRTATSPATSLGRWFLRVAVNRHSAKPNRYPASDIPAERRSSHASS